MAGISLILCTCFYLVQGSTRVLNCIKIENGEVGSTGYHTEEREVRVLVPRSHMERRWRRSSLFCILSFHFYCGNTRLNDNFWCKFNDNFWCKSLATITACALQKLQICSLVHINPLPPSVLICWQRVEI